MCAVISFELVNLGHTSRKVFLKSEIRYYDPQCPEILKVKMADRYAFRSFPDLLLHGSRSKLGREKSLINEMGLRA